MPKGVYFITDSSFGSHEELEKRALDLGVNERHGMGELWAPEPADKVGGVKPQLNAGISRL